MVKHLAIIMDGNGRWADARGVARAWGHREGARRLDGIVEECVEQGITHLTIYAFSTENWNRPQREVSFLMRLIAQYLRRWDRKLVKNRVSLVSQGEIERLPDYPRKELERVIQLTDFPDARMKLNVSLSYGGRQEIVRAARRIAEKVRAGELEPEAVSEQDIVQGLYHPDFPDPDLLIRTGGDLRVSNFLLWQIAYSEIYVTETYWPDFDRSELIRALEAFKGRERRFGKTSAQVKVEEPEARA